MLLFPVVHPFYALDQITHFSFPFGFVHYTLIIYVVSFSKINQKYALLLFVSESSHCIALGIDMFLIKFYNGQFMPHFWWKQSWVAGGAYSFSEGATESDIGMCIRDPSFCLCIYICKSLPSWQFSVHVSQGNRFSPTIAKTKTLAPTFTFLKFHLLDLNSICIE